MAAKAELASIDWKRGAMLASVLPAAVAGIVEELQTNPSPDFDVINDEAQAALRAINRAYGVKISPATVRSCVAAVLAVLADRRGELPAKPITPATRRRIA